MRMGSNLVKDGDRLKKIERLSLVGEMTSQLTHDIRNQLAVIKCATEMLEARLRGGLNEKEQKQFSLIDKSIVRISSQLSRL